MHDTPGAIPGCDKNHFPGLEGNGSTHLAYHKQLCIRCIIYAEMNCSGGTVKCGVADS